MSNLIDKIKEKYISELPEMFKNINNDNYDDIYLVIEDDTSIRLDVLTRAIRLLYEKGILDDKDI